MEEIINTSTLQTLTLLSILGVLLSQTCDQMHNALNNEPIRQKNLRSASVFFILATFVSIVLIPLMAVVIILGGSIPILLEKSAWYSPDQLPYYIILLPAIFLSIGAVRFLPRASKAVCRQLMVSSYKNEYQPGEIHRRRKGSRS